MVNTNGDSDVIGYSTFENYLEHLREMGLYDLVDTLELNSMDILEAFEDRAMAKFSRACEGEGDYQHPHHLPLNFGE